MGGPLLRAACCRFRPNALAAGAIGKTQRVTTSQTPSAPAIPAQAWWTLAISSAAIFMVSLEITVISLAFGEISAAFPDSSRTTLSWIFTAYNIGVASLLLVAGWLADRYGRKRVFLIGLGLFGLASLGTGLATNVEMLLTFRTLQSIGGSLLYPAALALLLPAFPVERRQMAIGIWGAMGGLAAALGPTIGAVLVDGFGWRAVFLINVPVALLALVVGQKRLVESKAENMATGVDFIGVPLASIGVGAVILGVVQARDWGLFSVGTLGSFAVGVALVVMFVVRTKTHPAPLFDLSLLTIRSYWVGLVGTVFFVMAFFGWLTQLPTFIEQNWGWSVLRTGFAIAPGPALSALLSPVTGRMADKYGNRPILLVGAVTGFVGSLWLVVFMDTEANYLVDMLPAMILIGISAGCSFAMLTGATMRDVPPARYGMGGAGRTVGFQLATALGIALAVAIVGDPTPGDDYLSAIGNSWIAGMVLYALMGATFLVLFVNRTSAQTAERG